MKHLSNKAAMEAAFADMKKDKVANLVRLQSVIIRATKLVKVIPLNI